MIIAGEFLMAGSMIRHKTCVRSSALNIYGQNEKFLIEETDPFGSGKLFFDVGGSGFCHGMKRTFKI